MLVVFHPEKALKPDLPEHKSFLSLDAKNVVVTTIKKGDDGETIFVRIFEDEGKNSTVNLRWGMPIESAAMTDLMEEGEEPLPVSRGMVGVSLGHHSIQTIRIVPH
jgi:alpha-mannosidase